MLNGQRWYRFNACLINTRPALRESNPRLLDLGFNASTTRPCPPRGLMGFGFDFSQSPSGEGVRHTVLVLSRPRSVWLTRRLLVPPVPGIPRPPCPSSFSLQVWKRTTQKAACQKRSQQCLITVCRFVCLSVFPSLIQSPSLTRSLYFPSLLPSNLTRALISLHMPSTRLSNMNENILMSALILSSLSLLVYN